MEKIIIVTRPTRLDALIEKFNTEGQAKFYIEHLGSDFSDYKQESDIYYRELDLLVSSMHDFGQVQILDWKFLPNYIFGKNDLVLTIGQDGLVANTLKYLDEQLLIGINSDKTRWDGILSLFSAKDAKLIAEKAQNSKATVREITKAKIELSDNQVLYAVNDFFVGVSNHASARYEISFNGIKEYQSSSGIIISTPLGSSGWMRSVLEGAENISHKIDGTVAHSVSQPIKAWSDDILQFAVREPFPSNSTQTSIAYGVVLGGQSLTIESKMGENGIIFSDGVQKDYLNFNYSVKANVTIAQQKGRLVVG